MMMHLAPLLFLLVLLSAASQLTVHAFTNPVPSRCVGVSSSTLLNEKIDATTINTVAKNEKKLRVVVVGGGWAGYSCCESISTNDNVEIILLDASKQAKGGLAGGYRSKNDRPVEAGKFGTRCVSMLYV